MIRSTSIFLALAFAGPALAGGPIGPTLNITGSCPGPISVDVTGLTPNGTAIVVRADDVGSATVPVGPCLGTQMDVDASSASLLATLTADANGAISLAPTASSAFCGLTVQVLDVSTCSPTASDTICDADADLDGVCADVDNCDDRYNPGQEDICDVIFVDDDAVGAGDGSSWADAYTTLQAAVAGATSDTPLWVAKGTYGPDAANARVADITDLSLYGGFLGDEWSLQDRVGYFDETIISGDYLGDDDGTVNTVSDNVAGVMVIRGITTLDGFTISGGYGTNSTRGGGIQSHGCSDCLLTNLIFRDNESDAIGGALYVSGGLQNVTITDSIFVDNVNSDRAAAIGIASAVTIRNVTFLRNITPQHGSAVGFIGAGPSADISFSTFAGGPASYAYLDRSGSINLTSSTFYGASVKAAPAEDLVATTTCASQDLSFLDASNIHLDDSTTELSDPFVVEGYRVYLAQTAAGDAFTSACVDAGDSTLAALEFPEHAITSTRSDGGYDLNNADPAAHYGIDPSVCIGNDNSGDTDGDRICDDIDAN